MECIQDMSHVSQGPGNAEEAMSRPVTRSAGGASRARLQHSSCGVHQQHLTTDTRSWVETTRPGTQVSEEGFMRDLTVLIQMFFDEILVAVRRHNGAALVPEVYDVLEMRKMFNLWDNGATGLDQRLARAHSVRELLVLNLLALIILLYDGIELYTPSIQNTLLRKTHRIFEQAATFVGFSSSDDLKHSSNTDIVDFLREKSQDIRSRVDNLYDQLPTIARLFDNYEEFNIQQVQGIRSGRPTPHTSEKVLTESQALYRKLHQYISRFVNSGNHSRTSHGARDSGINPLKQANCAVKHSSACTGSSNISSIFSDNGSYDDLRPLTDSKTSALTSEVQTAHGDSTHSNPTEGSLEYKIREDSCRSPANVEDKFCDALPCACSPRGMMKQTTKGRLLSIFGRSHLDTFEEEQQIRIRPPCRQKSMIYNALFDSGTQGNLILRSVADELGLQAYADNDVYVSAGGTHFDVKCYVKPDWQLLIGRKRHNRFQFYVVEELPGKLQVLVGNDTMSAIGIKFRVDKRTLVLRLIGGKDRNIQKQPQHVSQILDGSTRQDQKQMALAKTHAETRKSSEDEKPQFQASQQVLTKRKDDPNSRPPN